MDREPVRLGAVLPSVNTVIEPLYAAHLPSHVTLHSTRVYLANPLNEETLTAMRADVAHAGRLLSSCHVDVVLYLCTASAFATDADGERTTMEDLAARAGAPVVSVMESIEDACRATSVSKVALVSPYPDGLTEAEIGTLEAHGITTLSHRNIGISDSFELATPTPDEILALARDAWVDDADGILLTCANFHSQEIIDVLEREFSVPVITSTQAPLWRALRVVGIRDALPGWGRLFEC